MITNTTYYYPSLATFGKLAGSVGFLGGLLFSGASFSAGQVSSIQTSTTPATPFEYTVGGIEYRWGVGNNQIMEGLTVNGRQYTYALSADRVDIQRDDISGVATGEPCGIFVERLAGEAGDATRQFAADYPSDGSGTGNCDLSALLASRVLNRGAVDLFSNVIPDAKNIERLDYVFDFGVMAPFSADAMSLAGHVVAEKSSNNALKVAAILKLDVFGQPSAYGPMRLVEVNGCTDPALCYGITDLQHVYSFLQNDFNAPQSFPQETERSRESIGMAYVSTENLGLVAGQRYYGFSLFADDVEQGTHNLLDPSTFPDDTSDDEVVPGDDADLYGGLSGYFIADDLSVVTGAVFNDINGNGLPENNEAGISDIGISLYQDNDGSGTLDSAVDTPLGDSIDSDLNGNFVLPGLPDGNYLVVMDESDPELPPGLQSAPGTNPHPLTISGGDAQPVYFPFVNGLDNGNTDGGADGTADSGGADDGGADGATDAGGADGGGADGTADAGGADDGGADGATDAGGADGGADGTADAGGADDGGADGTADSGGADDGGADGTADAGGADDGGADGTADAGGDDGTTDSGSTDGGTPPVNDQGTRAVDDQFSLNQGTSDTFDVLANDLDGTGLGLTLVSVSGSSNATITITDDNQVNYRPNFGFYTIDGAPDTFLYVMEDSDGTRLTGNVSVDVIRFSDLNNNMRNDFVECNCTNLTLETGVNGSGVGTVSGFASALLALLLLMRRRTVYRAGMKRLIRGATL